MSESLVTIASYWFLSDAMVAQHALDAAGIESAIAESAIRGVKLRVNQTDALRAGAVLDSSCETLEEIGEADEERDRADDACPACGSIEIVRNSRVLLFATMAALFLGVGIAIGATEAGFFGALAAGVMLLISDRHKCAECGETWN
ncbi:MAG TPA: hypothetical protein VKB93_00380 [Thermoanaerobaculia bacterium]|nr:hypothetical protein [Thermoanaerobaculia bacterium]